MTIVLIKYKSLLTVLQDVNLFRRRELGSQGNANIKAKSIYSELTAVTCPFSLISWNTTIKLWLFGKQI